MGCGPAYSEVSTITNRLALKKYFCTYGYALCLTEI